MDSQVIAFRAYCDEGNAPRGYSVNNDVHPFVIGERTYELRSPLPFATHEHMGMVWARTSDVLAAGNG